MLQEQEQLQTNVNYFFQALLAHADLHDALDERLLSVPLAEEWEDRTVDSHVIPGGRVAGAGCRGELSCEVGFVVSRDERVRLRRESMSYHNGSHWSRSSAMIMLSVG